MRKRPASFLDICRGTVAATLVVAGAAHGQTTGRIEGRAHDAAGVPLAGVAVLATSAALPGQVSSTAAADGRFRLLNLPPGTYRLEASLEGFQPIQQDGIRVGIDRAVELDLTLSAAFGEEVEVLGVAPVVDVSRATSGLSLASDTFDRLPLQRDIYAVAQLATGTARDAAGTTFYGSTGAENGYVIEGLNSTGVRYGTEGKSLNFDFVQEVEIKTGGLPAEYGRLTGGLVSAITRAGGNRFEASVFGFLDAPADDATAEETPGSQASVDSSEWRYDFGFTLGGAIVADRLWYFAAFDRQERETVTDVVRAIPTVSGFESPPSIGDRIHTRTTTDLYSAKLTWRAAENQSLALSIIGDPSTVNGAVLPVSGPTATFDGENERGADDYLLRFDGLLGSSWDVEALAGVHREKGRFSGEGTEIPLYQDLTGPVPFPVAGGFGYFENQHHRREQVKADVTKFFGSQFELKLGGDRERVRLDTNRFMGGDGQTIYILGNPLQSDGPLVYLHRYFVDANAPDFDRDDPTTWRLNKPAHAEPENTNTSAYVQGSWRPSQNLAIHLGLRWEEQEVGDSNGGVVARLDDNWAPRLQFAWDPKSTGRAKLYGSYGRYYESIPLDINVRNFGAEAQCLCFNLSRDPEDRIPADETVVGFRSTVFGGPTQVDPDLRGQYVDEYLLGYESELAPDLVVGVQLTYRDLGRVIEDFLVDAENGQYAIANPGEGLGRTMYFYDYTPVAGVEASRTFEGVELNVRKRYSEGWQLYASYLWSKLEGNYDGLFQASTGQLDPNMNSAFDYADFAMNADGKLTNDRTHTLKLVGSYSVPRGRLKGLGLGLSTYWRSGAPLTAYGYSFGYANWEYYLTSRGSLGRGPSDYEASVHLDYPLELGDHELRFVLDIFNLLDRQSATTLDQRYNLASQGPCAGIPDGLCGAGGGLQHRPGSLTPVAQLANPRGTATNPDFLRAGTAFTGQRTIRFGIRYRF